MAFEVATYNVLATAYLGRGDYSAVPPGLLDPEWRVPALVRHVAALGADVLCLQEVEADAFAALREGLGPLGYSGLMEFKGRGKPDGCATFYREGRFTPRRSARLSYQDDEGGPGEHSGFLALLLALSHEGRTLGVANTHLRWDPPGRPRREQVGHRQAAELIEACGGFDPVCDGWVVCGDFNRRPDSEVVATFREDGFDFAHRGRPHVISAVTDRRSSLIDHLFHTRTLAATPIDPPPVDGSMVLPSREHPSDHLALAASFEWAG
jgi:mRNA deadenylase 3'-5' endonuclease subunit Ccr4